MSEPVVFISHFRVRDGKMDGLLELQRTVTARIEADKPRTLVFLAYLSEEGTHVSFLHVFADAESMDVHFEGADERSRAAHEYMEPKGWELYGSPSDEAFDTLRQAASAGGVTLTVEPNFMAGFLRVEQGNR